MEILRLYGLRILKSEHEEKDLRLVNHALSQRWLRRQARPASTERPKAGAAGSVGESR